MSELELTQRWNELKPRLHAYGYGQYGTLEMPKVNAYVLQPDEYRRVAREFEAENRFLLERNRLTESGNFWSRLEDIPAFFAGNPWAFQIFIKQGESLDRCLDHELAHVLETVVGLPLGELTSALDLL